MALPVTGGAGSGEPGGPEAEEEQVSILLVDDQPENLVAMEAMLEGLGQRLLIARSGRDALRTLLSSEVAVILLDVKMPDLDGFETAALIHARERTRDIPIIFLTAAAPDHADAMRGYAVGAVDYLIKPVVPELVRSKVSVFVELAKRTRQLERNAALLRAREQEARELAETRAELVADLEHKNRELESFGYTVSHDLRAPLRRIEGFARALAESHAAGLDAAGARYLARIRESTAHMVELIDALFLLSRVARHELRFQSVDLSALAERAAADLRLAEPGRAVELTIRPGLEACGDARLLRTVVENLLGNAWKFTAGRKPARIEFGASGGHAERIYFVRDNGAGFDMAFARRLFSPFQRLHSASEFPGTGVGLATVQRIIQRHGGRVWAEAVPGEGATFWFTVGRSRAG